MKRPLRTTALLLAAALAATAQAGCSPQWKKKFVRKRAKPVVVQPIFTLESGDAAAGPPAVRYRERFAYWRAWHVDLLTYLGENKKRDIKYLGGAIGELGSMSGILTEGPQAERLREIIKELSDLRDAWNAREGAWFPPSTERRRLEKLQREIDKGFNYTKVKQWIPEAPPKKE